MGRNHSCDADGEYDGDFVSCWSCVFETGGEGGTACGDAGNWVCLFGCGDGNRDFGWGEV